MPRVLVSGLVNLETTVRIDGFPIPYFPVRYPFFGVATAVSGVGYNVVKALKALGDTPLLLSLVAPDPAGRQVREALSGNGLDLSCVLDGARETPQSVILYDADGRRQIHVDLKDVQERAYPWELFVRALPECDAAALCNVNFSRPFLSAAREAGKLVATDVHAVASLDDDYNVDFLKAAHVVFLSDESLPVPAEEFARELGGRFGTEVVVVGMGARGALLHLPAEGAVERVPALTTRPVVSTIGAGDALFSAFLSDFARGRDARRALRRAVVFASWKIGAASASDGFLDRAALAQLEASA
ncbi:MAG: carbohydrate kinase family protein [Thermoanaerobaculia bacterium]